MIERPTHSTAQEKAEKRRNRSGTGETDWNVDT